MEGGLWFSGHSLDEGIVRERKSSERFTRIWELCGENQGSKIESSNMAERWGLRIWWENFDFYDKNG